MARRLWRPQAAGGGGAPLDGPTRDHSDRPFAGIIGRRLHAPVQEHAAHADPPPGDHAAWRGSNACSAGGNNASGCSCASGLCSSGAAASLALARLSILRTRGVTAGSGQSQGPRSALANPRHRKRWGPPRPLPGHAACLAHAARPYAPPARASPGPHQLENYGALGTVSSLGSQPWSGLQRGARDERSGWAVALGLLNSACRRPCRSRYPASKHHVTHLGGSLSEQRAPSPRTESISPAKALGGAAARQLGETGVPGGNVTGAEGREAGQAASRDPQLQGRRFRLAQQTNAPVSQQNTPHSHHPSTLHAHLRLTPSLKQ